MFSKSTGHFKRILSWILSKIANWVPWRNSFLLGCARGLFQSLFFGHLSWQTGLYAAFFNHIFHNALLWAIRLFVSVLGVGPQGIQSPTHTTPPSENLTLLRYRERRTKPRFAGWLWKTCVTNSRECVSGNFRWKSARCHVCDCIRVFLLGPKTFLVL